MEESRKSEKLYILSFSYIFDHFLLIPTSKNDKNQ